MVLNFSIETDCFSGYLLNMLFYVLVLLYFKFNVSFSLLGENLFTPIFVFRRLNSAAFWDNLSVLVNFSIVVL